MAQFMKGDYLCTIEHLSPGHYNPDILKFVNTKNSRTYESRCAFGNSYLLEDPKNFEIEDPNPKENIVLHFKKKDFFGEELKYVIDRVEDDEEIELTENGEFNRELFNRLDQVNEFQSNILEKLERIIELLEQISVKQDKSD